MNKDCVETCMQKLLKETHSGININVLKIFKNKHPNIHWTEISYKNSGETILHIAARNGHIEIIKFLLNNYQPLSIDARTNGFKTALHEATQTGQLDVIAFLIEKGANVNALQIADWTPLMLAAVCKKATVLAIVKLLVINGAEINALNKDGWSVLHLSAWVGIKEVFDYLIINHADWKGVTKNGRSVLHIASLHGHLNIVKECLALGIDVAMKDNCGNNALHEAVLSPNNDLSVCKFLIECNNFDLKQVNNVGYNILHLIASVGNLSMLHFVLSDLNFDPNLCTPTGITPLHCAGRKNNYEAYKMLLNYGADESLQDNFQRTALDYLKMA